MDTSSPFRIDFTAIPADGSTLSWHLDDDFFGKLDQQTIGQGNVEASLRIRKKTAAFELQFEVRGEVCIPCDRCLEPMTQAIDAQDTIQVRFGDSREDEGDTVTVTIDDPTLDVAWNLYETIALAIPTSHTHPEGQCLQTMAQLLARHTAGADRQEPVPRADSPWAVLGQLLDAPTDDNETEA